MSQSTTTRGLGFWMCLALVIGNMIGASVFLLPAALAPYGVNSLLGWPDRILAPLDLTSIRARHSAKRWGS
jgi:APA family basic amino acid/polyamine antiporter